MAAGAQASDFNAPSKKIPMLKQVPEARHEEVLKPRASGVIIMMSEHGLQVFSPLAPMNLGIGEKILTRSASLDPRPANPLDDTKPFGGMSLIGFEF